MDEFHLYSIFTKLGKKKFNNIMTGSRQDEEEKILGGRRAKNLKIRLRCVRVVFPLPVVPTMITT
jgi:hypothetical protein